MAVDSFELIPKKSANILVKIEFLSSGQIAAGLGKIR